MGHPVDRVRETVREFLRKSSDYSTQRDGQLAREAQSIVQCLQHDFIMHSFPP